MTKIVLLSVLLGGSCGGRDDGWSKRCEEPAPTETATPAFVPDDDVGNGIGPCDATPHTRATPAEEE